MQSEIRVKNSETFIQGVLLTFLFSVPALRSLRVFDFIRDYDIWWHIATGDWILKHRAIPRTDPFSLYEFGKPWAAYSWLFEASVAWCVAHFGLFGLFVFHAILVTAIIAALHRLITHAISDFTIAALLTLVSFVAMSGLMFPRPWLVTILFFIIAYDLVRQARLSSEYRPLLFLPLIFCIWANAHVQFVYGLLLLCLATADAWLSWLRNSSDAALLKTRNRWTLVTISCVLATLINPYFVDIYKVAFQLGTQPDVLNLIGELQSIPFRSLPDYLVLFIAIAATGALVWMRERCLFTWVLFAWALLSTFRTQRDLWLTAITGIVAIASALSKEAQVGLRRSKFQAVAVAFGVVLVVGTSCLITNLSSQKLEKEIATLFPAMAVEAVKSKGISGPLFNSYNWGGYLIWALPNERVSIDGRALLHGTPRITRSMGTWNSKHDWAANPELENSRLIIGEMDSALCSLLRTDRRYELIYEDKLSSVFVRRDQKEAVEAQSGQ